MRWKYFVGQAGLFSDKNIMKARIKSVIENTESFAGKVFVITVQCLIVVSMATFSIDTLPDLSYSLRQWLQIAEIITVAFFTLEYLARLWVADSKLGFVFSFYGLIDLLAILPFYLSSGVDLRSLRIFRLLRLFRILKLLRYSQAIKRFHRAFLIAKEELVLFSAVSLILLYLSAVGIYYFENQAQPEQFKSVFHSLWWAVATLTTVGYGDVFPVTAGGRVFTFFVLMLGLGVIAVPTGLVASALSQARKEDA